MSSNTGQAGGALAGLRVVDLSRQAPGPYCSMLLADFGADVVLVEPPGGSTRGERTNTYWELETDPEVSRYAALRRNKRSIVLDLKDDADHAVMLELIDGADVLIEGFRPGVADRLGVGPSAATTRNPRLVYCSITGNGQEGAAAQQAGHDINYLADAGILSIIAAADGTPALPLNLVADFAGGGLMAAYAIMVALRHRDVSGQGQVIDLGMIDGTFSLLTHAVSLHFARGADLRPNRYFLSGSLPQYGTYRCADGRFAAVGALEPWFFRRLMAVTGRGDLDGAHDDPTRHDEVREHLRSWFAARDRHEVAAAFADDNPCVNIVRSVEEALELARERGMLLEADGIPQLGVAPRLSATPGTVRTAPPRPGDDSEAIRGELAVAAPPDQPADPLAEVVAMYRARGVGNPLGFGERCAVLVVDFQQAYTRTWRARSTEPVENTATLLAAARAAGVPIVYTYQGYDPVDPDGGVFTRKAPTLLEYRRGSWECEIDPLIEPAAADWVIEKRAPSAFFATGLGDWLRERSIDTVVTCGTSLSGCVRASVVDGMSNDLRMLVVRDCVSDPSEPSLNTSLVEIAVKYGDVISLGEALAGVGAIGATEERA